MQKKIKSLIIVLIIIALVLTLIIYNISKNVENPEKNEESVIAQNEQKDFEKIQEDPSIIINGKKLEPIKSEGVYLTIEKAIKKYTEYANKQNSEAIYSLLYDEYISLNNLNKENILQNIGKYPNYKISKLVGLSTLNYGIFYLIINTENADKFLMINWDTENETYSVQPISREEYDLGIQKGISVDKDRIKSIEKNDYNKISSQKADNDSIAQKYFYDFIEKVVNNTELAYKQLDNEYKNINFETYNEFKEYVKDNKEILQSLDHNNFKTHKDFTNYEDYEKYYQEKSINRMKDYAQTTVNGEKTYIFKDSYGKYYIFKVSAAMEYTVLMDNYTIPTNDFTSEYEEMSEQEKVVLNIKRFFMGIDDKNYGYSYSVLAKSFKENKYPTKSDFVKYAKQNFFEKNEIQYISCEKENGVFIYKISITDATGKSTDSKPLNMILKLNNGTNFEMSFGTN